MSDNTKRHGPHCTHCGRETLDPNADGWCLRCRAEQAEQRVVTLEAQRREYNRMTHKVMEERDALQEQMEDAERRAKDLKGALGLARLDADALRERAAERDSMAQDITDAARVLHGQQDVPVRIVNQLTNLARKVMAENDALREQVEQLEHCLTRLRNMLLMETGQIEGTLMFGRFEVALRDIEAALSATPTQPTDAAHTKAVKAGDTVRAIACDQGCDPCRHIGRTGTALRIEGHYNGVPIWWVEFPEPPNAEFTETTLAVVENAPNETPQPTDAAAPLPIEYPIQANIPPKAEWPVTIRIESDPPTEAAQQQPYAGWADGDIELPCHTCGQRTIRAHLSGDYIVQQDPCTTCYPQQQPYTPTELAALKDGWDWAQLDTGLEAVIPRLIATVEAAWARHPCPTCQPPRRTNPVCETCQDSGMRPLTKEEYNTPRAVEIVIGPIFGPEGRIGVSMCHCECEIGRAKLERFKHVWYAALLCLPPEEDGTHE